MSGIYEMEKTNNSDSSREKTIIRTSIIGIIANVFLAAFKAVIGIMTHSIAIVLDAVNNISDAGSSLITIVGTKLAGKEPDKKHPFGYGRIEYLSAMIISVIVLYAGITSFVESVKQILHPETPEYNTISLIIVAVAVVVKVLLGRYVKSVGEKVNSDSLINSGEDATLDSIIDPELAREIKHTVTSFPDVQGAYDLVLNNYGPDAWNGSIHIEVPDTYTADQLDLLIRKIQMAVYKKHRVALTAIGVYSIWSRKKKQCALILWSALRQKTAELFTKKLSLMCRKNFLIIRFMSLWIPILRRSDASSPLLPIAE